MPVQYSCTKPPLQWCWFAPPASTEVFSNICLICFDHPSSDGPQSESKKDTSSTTQSDTGLNNPLHPLLCPNASLYCQIEPRLNQSAPLVSPVPKSIFPTSNTSLIKTLLYLSLNSQASTLGKLHIWGGVCLYACHRWRLVFTVALYLRNTWGVPTSVSRRWQSV